MNAISRFNQKIATKITNAVSTMWCAYIFAAIALISLPAAIKTGDSLVIVAWVAQTFLQLVLLSIIMVGQDQSAKGLHRRLMKLMLHPLVSLNWQKRLEVLLIKSFLN